MTPNCAFGDVVSVDIYARGVIVILVTVGKKNVLRE